MNGGSGKQGYSRRDRLRYNILKRRDIETIDELETMEALLGFVFPEGEVRDIAYELIGRFGSAKNAIEANVMELTEIRGISQDNAESIKLLSRLIDRINIGMSLELEITRIEDIRRFLASYFMSCATEASAVLPISAKHRIICAERISEGFADRVELDPKRVISSMLMHGSKCCIIAHCHPNGSPVPSDEDLRQTRILLNHLRIMGLQLADHYVVSHGGVISMREKGYLGALDI